jgi:hypothetical protein
LASEFDVLTPLGYVAILGQDNWERHEAKRKELEGLSESVRLTCEQPEVVIETNDGCHHFYRRGLGIGRLEHHHLHVLVREFPIPGENVTEHIVVTAWFTRVLEEGRTLWPNPS